MCNPPASRDSGVASDERHDEVQGALSGKVHANTVILILKIRITTLTPDKKQIIDLNQNRLPPRQIPCSLLRKEEWSRFLHSSEPRRPLQRRSMELENAEGNKKVQRSSHNRP